MIIDNTQPWVESKVKLPKLGRVLEAILEIERQRIETAEDLTALLTSVETNVGNSLLAFDNDLKAAILAHTSKKGPAHGETKTTIGLGKKENLPAASLADIENGIYKREFLTPETLHALIDTNLNIDPSLYVKSGTFPLSYGVTLGRAVYNQRYIGTDFPLNNDSPASTSQALLSSEDSYLLFADQGDGYDNDFSEGGIKAPVGTTLVNIANDNINTVKGVPASLNDITATDQFVATYTGREFGFTDGRGNYFDSNFHPQQVIDNSNLSNSPKQSFESTLFNPTLVYKPDGTYTFKNFDLTKHNFSELVPLMDGLYPFNDVTMLSSDNFIMHVANTHLAIESGMWGICVDILSGDCGTPDWYRDSITKNTNKILSKRSEYVIRQTTINSISGYDGALGLIRVSNGKLPVGFSVNRSNFDDSNFYSGKRYGTIFIPIKALINGFNNLSTTQQRSIIDRIDTDLLKRVTLCWDNKFNLTGLMRVPLYLKHSTDTTIAHSIWVDLRFKFNVLADYTTIDCSALNFDTNSKPNLDSNLNLQSPLGKWVEYNTDLSNNPLNPKIIGGCFLETGGHIRNYTVGHRQYICYYKHQVTSVKDWVLNNKTPVITDTRIKDSNLFPCNGFYGEALRTIPVSSTDTTTTYLSYMRNKKGKYGYATFSLSSNFDLSNDGVANPNNLTWLDRNGEKDLPVLVANLDFNSNILNITGLVFSESNSFTGSYNPNFNGVAFSPVNPVIIERLLQNRAIRNSNILNPYAIFYYYQNVLHWVICDKYGIKNSAGNDVCFGSVRVDIYKNDDGVFEIRQLPTMEEKYVWGSVFETQLADGYYGRNKDSFDDVFITRSETSQNALNVYVNYPNLPGKYFHYSILMDSLGYYNPTQYTGSKIDIETLNGYKKKLPHNFYPSYPAPMMTPKHFYRFTQTLYGFEDVTGDGVSSKIDYYMGWKKELPIYVIGSNITVNGRSLLVDKTVKLSDYENQSGAMFVTYTDEAGGEVYTYNNNPSARPTEPTTSIIFTGFWYKIKDVWAFSYHAERTVTSINYADFLNGLLPTVDNRQMSTYAMGSTFPLYLGKLNSNPRQYFFKS